MLDKLGKLLKYEFRFYFRVMPPLYLVLALLAFPAGFQMKQSGEYNQFQTVILTVIWGIIIGAMTVMTIVLIIQRFNDNFLKNPGSLMFTLPVTTWALTASKAIAAVCVVLMSVLVITVSALVYAIGSGNLSFSSINFQGTPAEIIVLILAAVFMILSQICLIYAAISASHILPRFRFAAGAVMYFAVMYFMIQPVFRFLSNQIFQKNDGILYNFSISSNVVTMIPFGTAALVFAAIFFWTAGFLLKNTLNLE